MATTDLIPVLEWFASEDAVHVVARALIKEHHRGIVEGLPVETSDCGGWRTNDDPPCGGCAACIYSQAIAGDFTDEGWEFWQDKARRLLNDAGHQLAFKMGRGTV